ncbi:MAG: Rieske (2Fe-2S) protein [Planctomycetota bacterium]|nr:MAG: Rieske (2Fe-2S) protein [Planctomycetota bacterium]
MSDDERPSPAAGEAESGNAPPPSPGVDRRGFLHLLGLGLGASAAATILGAVGTAALKTPLTARGVGGGWVDLGPLARFPDGAPAKVVAVGEHVDAWNRFPARSLGGVVVVREGARARAFSSVCPHNGCDVFVRSEDLRCPCHESVFALDGSLVRGESPRGLDPLEVRIEEGRLRVRYQRFEVGIAERRPLG